MVPSVFYSEPRMVGTGRCVPGVGMVGVGTGDGGTYYQGWALALACHSLAQPSPRPAWPSLVLDQLAPFQPQDPARVFPTFRLLRVVKHERGGSA